MRKIILGGAAALLGGGAYLAGALSGGTSDRGVYHAVSPAVVSGRLAALQFGSELGPNEAGRIRLVLRDRSATLMRWDLIIDSRRIADVRASFSPESNGTRVAVDADYAYSAVPMEPRKAALVSEVVEIIMNEKVDSTIEGRAFDGEGVKAKTKALEAANPQATAEIEEAFQNGAVRGGTRLEDEQAYGNRPVGSRAPGKPPDFSETHADGGWGNK